MQNVLICGKSPRREIAGKQYKNTGSEQTKWMLSVQLLATRSPRQSCLLPFQSRPPPPRPILEAILDSPHPQEEGLRAEWKCACGSNKGLRLRRERPRQRTQVSPGPSRDLGGGGIATSKHRPLIRVPWEHQVRRRTREGHD